MKFAVFMFQGLLVNICNQVNRSFSNNMSIDVIVACSSFTVVSWLLRTVSHSGEYVYRAERKNLRNCICVSLIVAFIEAVLVFLFADKIVRLYSLTDVQFEICAIYMRVYAVGLPIATVGDFVDMYALLNSKVKELIIANIFFYGFEIGIAWYVVTNGLGVGYLQGGTVVAYVVFILILIPLTGVYREKDKISLTVVLSVFKDSCNLLCDRIFGQASVVYYNIMASRLGTELYAVHSVCYSVAVFGEVFTNVYSNYVLVRLNGLRESLRFDGVRRLRSGLRWKLAGMYALAVVPLVFLLKGDVGLKECLCYVYIYCAVYHLSLLYYESYRAYLFSMGAVRQMRMAGFFGLLARVAYVSIVYSLGMGLWAFALTSAIDYGVRYIVYYSNSIKVSRGYICES